MEGQGAQQGATPKQKRKPYRWEKLFLKGLSRCGMIGRAADYARVDRGHVARCRRECSEFDELCKGAEKAFQELAEREADRRGIKGLKRKKFYKGEPVIDPETRKQYVEREYSDSLLMFRLKAIDPEKYRESVKHEHGGPGGGSIPIVHDIADLRKLAPDELARLYHQSLGASGAPQESARPASP